MSRVITFDLEIMKGPEESGGWDEIRRGNGGVSCVGLYDTVDGFHLYTDAQLEECAEHLNMADMLVSFNGIEFDIPCFQGYTGIDLLVPNYDVLHEVWRALGERRKGYKLADICRREKLGAKTLNGASAPELYAKKQFSRLWAYCLNDVYLTRELAKHINREGGITTPEGEFLELERPMVEV